MKRYTRTLIFIQAVIFSWAQPVFADAELDAAIADVHAQNELSDEERNRQLLMLAFIMQQATNSVMGNTEGSSDDFVPPVINEEETSGSDNPLQNLLGILSKASVNVTDSSVDVSLPADTLKLPNVNVDAGGVGVSTANDRVSVSW